MKRCCGTIDERLAAHSVDRNGCRLWTGAMTAFGQGQIRINGKNVLAYRASWESRRGPIPPGMCVCHRCDNPGCINIDHLFLGTKAENSADMVAKGRSCRGRKPSAKLNAAKVRAIRALRGKATQKEIAAQFGVSRSAIYAIQNRKRYEWVDGA